MHIYICIYCASLHYPVVPIILYLITVAKLQNQRAGNTSYLAQSKKQKLALGKTCLHATLAAETNCTQEI